MDLLSKYFKTDKDNKLYTIEIMLAMFLWFGQEVFIYWPCSAYLPLRSYTFHASNEVVLSRDEESDGPACGISPVLGS